jgi:inner membrane protein
MDVLTQGLLGAALAQSAARRHEIRLAGLIGAAAGLLADADVLIRSDQDPLLTLEYHRHFTHALVFVPVGALIAAVLLWPLLRRRLGFGRLYLFSLLGYSLSGVLDAFTTYGTHLFWPFLGEAVSWNLIAVVDPVFTLALLIGVGVALVHQTPRPAWIALACCALYLGAGWVQRDRAEDLARGLAEARGHVPARLLVKPTLGNLLVWRSLYEADGTFHVDAVRPGLGGTRVYPGGTAERLVPARDFADLPPRSVAYRDLRQFADFSNGWLARHPQRPEVIGDLRYSMTPNGVTPIWGIEIDPRQPDEHVELRFFRELTEADRARFLAMLAGRDLIGAQTADP